MSSHVRSGSLSDSELDFSSTNSLSNRSHFFSSRGDLCSTAPIVYVEGRLAMPESKTRLEEEEPAYSFDNRAGLAHDLSFLASMPELCDVTFLVGEDRHPVCGVKAVLAARSR